MNKVYAYDVSSNNFRVFQSPDEWKQQMTCEGARNYLVYHLLESLENEFFPAIEAFHEDSYRTGVGKGFFSLLRMIFPAITFLGTLYKRTDTSTNAISFMRDYMGQVNKKYKHISDLIYNVYRHGLMHSYMPKVLEIDKKFVGWEITYNDDNHLRISKSKNDVKISLSPNRFFQDLLKALVRYISDFDDPKKKEQLLKNFTEGFMIMSEVLNESDLLKRRCRTGLQYLKSIRRNF